MAAAVGTLIAALHIGTEIFVLQHIGRLQCFKLHRAGQPFGFGAARDVAPEELLQVLKINKKQIKAYVALAKERHDVKLTAHLLDLLGEASQKNVIDNVMQYLQTRELSKQNIERVFPELSASEQEICYLILQNRKLSEICTLLNKSESNITTQRANIRKKLGMGSADNLKKVLEKRIAESQ